MDLKKILQESLLQLEILLKTSTKASKQKSTILM